MTVGQRLIVFFAVFLTACGTSDFDKQVAELQASRERRNESFHRLLVKIHQLPPEQRKIELERLQRRLDAEAREQQTQGIIDSQQELTRAIDDLSSQLEQSRY